MRFCLMIEGNEDVGWGDWLTLADACERLGLEGLFRSDHYLSVHDPSGRGSTDAWTTIAALAARTERIRLGTLVSPATFRHPSVLAKCVATADHISGGRVELGVGAGWYESEHRAHGFSFRSPADRFALLEEQLAVVYGLFTQPAFSHSGVNYALEHCVFLPKPFQRPHPPIIIGGNAGPRLADLVARYATEFNSNQGSPDDCHRRFGRIRRGAEAVGRDPQAITTSVMTGCIVGATRRDFLRRVDQTARWMRSDVRTLLDAAAPAWILGTPQQAVEKLRAFRQAGVERIMLQHNLHRDTESIELLATEVFPHVD